MTDIGTSGFKVIHWEYIKSSDSVTKVDNFFMPKVVVKPDTNIKNGVLLRFVVRFYKGEKVTLDFIGEQVFIIEDILSFNLPDAMNIIQVGFDNCTAEFVNYYKKETGLSGTKPYHTVKTEEGNLILSMLRN